MKPFRKSAAGVFKGLEADRTNGWKVVALSRFCGEKLKERQQGSIVRAFHKSGSGGAGQLWLLWLEALACYD